MLLLFVFPYTIREFFASIQCRLFPAHIMWWTASGVLHEVNHPATNPFSPTSPPPSPPQPPPTPPSQECLSLHSIDLPYFILYYVSDLFAVVRFFSAVPFTSTQPHNVPRKFKKKLQPLISDNVNYFCSATSEWPQWLPNPSIDPSTH